jgi:periplasmic mercuric ion binding protein
MKTIKVFFVVSLLMAFGTSISAQAGNKDSDKQKTESFKVWGKCEMCKARIETGLKFDGISKALWNEKTLLVTVTYDPAKTNIDAMQKKLASIGHDTEKYKAPDNVYAKLPGCCHYDRVK